MKRNRDLLAKYSIIVNSIVFLNQFIPRFVFTIILGIIKRSDLKIAIFLRYLCIKRLSKSCGTNVAIFSNVHLFNISNISFGNNISIHQMCYINGSGGLQIGNNVSIAHSTSILTEEHRFDILNVNIKDQGLIYSPVFIEDNVWIGCGVIILAGLTIESGSIIAAGAVVNKSVNVNSIVGGVPIKLLKERG